MNDPALNKDRSILDVLARLERELGEAAFRVVDHWEASACAIGVASPKDQRVLAYISTFDKPEGYYFLSLELAPPPGSERSYAPAGEFEHVDFPKLAWLIKRHLRGGEAQGDEGWQAGAQSAPA